jgi:uncharacterized protein YcbX
VFISRIGYAAVKGSRHIAHDDVELTAAGPVGDRAFCLIDRARDRVLRTVENPVLLQASATLRFPVLTVQLPARRVEGVPKPTGEEIKVDYWGRSARVELLDGPFAAAFSELLGFEVVLARAAQPGEVVYAGPVSLVTTGSLRLLEESIGPSAPAVAGERFRPTFVVDADEPHVEDTWAGLELQLGAEARVRVNGRLPRCAVIDLDPSTGRRDMNVLGTLAGYRHLQHEIYFGVDAVVTAPGRVRDGDPVLLGEE